MKGFQADISEAIDMHGERNQVPLRDRVPTYYFVPQP